jgi:hypothetical protein
VVFPRSEPRFSSEEPDGVVKRSGVTMRKSTRVEELPPGVSLVSLDFEFGSETLHRVDTGDGSYYELNGLTTSEIGNPLEPMFVHDSTLSGTEFRGVLFTGGEYTDETGFDPTVGAPASNNVDRGEGPLPNATTFLPSIGKTGGAGGGGRGMAGRTVRGTRDGEAGQARLMVSVGHYLGGQRHRLFNAMNFEMYYSNGTDRVAPQIVDPGPNAVLHEETGDGLSFTATATDNVKVFRVLITYSTERGEWRSLDLVREGGTSQWSGELPGVKDALYLVQAIDVAGNSSYLAKPTNDTDSAGHPWGTQSAGPRLFVAGDIATKVGHGVVELWWSLAGLMLLGVLSVRRRRQARRV